MEKYEEINCKTNIGQKYYKLNFPVKNCIQNGIFSTRKITIAEIFRCDPVKIYSDWVLDEDIGVSINKICVSDVYTHDERLVFPVFYVKNKKTQKRALTHRNINIAGEITMKIHGGDISKIHDVDYYVDELYKLNN